MAVTLSTGRVREFIDYHTFSESIHDIDPSYELLKYVCDRFELSMEQRYWLAFLYSTCYNASTVFYIYNEFPDYLGVDVGRLERWWKAHRHQLDFQTDCRWVRSSNLFVGMYMDYRSLAGENQEHTYKELVETQGAYDGAYGTAYENCYQWFGKIKYMGRFKLFLLLEAVHVVTGLPITPDKLPLEEAQSSRNGLCFALGRDDLLCGHDYGREELTKDEYKYLYDAFEGLLRLMQKRSPETRIDYWNVETTLCAYKKWHRGKRFPGYYINRQADEINKMQKKVPEGVCWDVLWDFRHEFYEPTLLIENGYDNRNLWKSSSKKSGQLRLF